MKNAPLWQRWSRIKVNVIQQCRQVEKYQNMDALKLQKEILYLNHNNFIL